MVNLSEKRFKPISDPANVVFIIYFSISFLINLLTGPKYHDPYSFLMVLFYNLGTPLIPILFIAIYNIKKGKSVFGIISIIVSAFFLLVIIMEFYGLMMAEPTVYQQKNLDGIEPGRVGVLLEQKENDIDLIELTIFLATSAVVFCVLYRIFKRKDEAVNVYSETRANSIRPNTDFCALCHKNVSKKDLKPYFHVKICDECYQAKALINKGLSEISSSENLSVESDEFSRKTDFHQAPLSQSKTTSDTLHPWRRFWARSIDANLYFFLSLAVILNIPLGNLNNLQSDALIWIAVYLTIWALGESISISNFGTTPGKALFRISVYDINGTALTFDKAFYRTLHVLLVGCGLAVPPINIVTYILSYFHLKKSGNTPWDKSGNFIVRHHKLGHIWEMLFICAALLMNKIAFNFCMAMW